MGVGGLVLGSTVDGEFLRQFRSPRCVTGVTSREYFEGLMLSLFGDCNILLNRVMKDFLFPQ